jgi:hypothetical protein
MSRTMSRRDRSNDVASAGFEPDFIGRVAPRGEDIRIPIGSKASESLAQTSNIAQAAIRGSGATLYE